MNLTYVARRPVDLLADALREIGWTPQARLAAVASRRARAKTPVQDPQPQTAQPAPQAQPAPRPQQAQPTVITTPNAAARSAQAGAVGKAKLAARKAGKSFVAPEAKADTATTGQIRSHVAAAGQRERAGATAQAKDLAAIGAGKEKQAAAVSQRSAQRVTAAVQAERKATKAAGKDPVAAQRKAISDKHDQTLKPMASELMAMAAAGKRGSSEYAAKYSAYTKAQQAKAAELKTTTVQAPPGYEKKGKVAKAAVRRVHTGAARSSSAKVGTGRQVARA